MRWTYARRNSEERGTRGLDRAGRIALGALAVAVLIAAVSTLAIPVQNGWPMDRLKVLEDGTVADQVTGRVWTANADAVGNPDPWDGVTWPDALALISRLNVGELPNHGHSDWRLPRVQELLGLFNASWNGLGHLERANRHFDRILC